MNIHRTHLFHSAAICLLGAMALLSACDRSDNVTGITDTPNEGTRYLLQPPTISIEPFGGGSPATRAAVAIPEERQAFNIGEELGNIITLGNSEVKDTPQTRTLADGIYYRIVVYKESELNAASPKILAQRLCKIGSSDYFADAEDDTTPIYLYPGNYKIFCYSFNKKELDNKIFPLTDGTANVSLADGDDFLSSEIISISIDSGQLGGNVSLGSITLKHRCCLLTGTLTAVAFETAGISNTPTPTLSVTGTFYATGNWSIKNNIFSGGATTSNTTFTLTQKGEDYVGTLMLLPISDKSLSASYSFKPNGGKQVSANDKSIASSTTFISGGSYAFTIKAIGAYVLTETDDKTVQIGSHKWAYANLDGQTMQQESKPWISGTMTGESYSNKGSVTASDTTNDWWRWNVLSVDIDDSRGNKEEIWNSSNDPCKVGLGSSWKVPPRSYFEDLVANNILRGKRVYINGKFITSNTYGWLDDNGITGCVFVDTGTYSLVFLPAAGKRYGSEYGSVGTSGLYWSSTPYPSFYASAYHLAFQRTLCGANASGGADFGFSLRCVQE